MTRFTLAGLALAVAIVPMLAACTKTAEGAPGGEGEISSYITEGGENMGEATFGAGCFWGVEAAFRRTEGVTFTEVGYSGGHTKNPTYEEVCRKGTGHAEVVHLKYDKDKVSYEELLDVFWTNHDPTQVNRQGPDVGDQYRTVIFYHTPEQKAAAEASKKALEESGKFSKPIATEIEEAQRFYRAEEYHQQYLEKRGLAQCHT